MDDKGNVMLVAWGISPFSSRYDPLDCVCSCLTIQQELTKLGLKCGIGVTTGVSFLVVCGTIGNKIEYSLIGEVVNFSSDSCLKD
jgi:class 3 adenylate cyclase